MAANWDKIKRLFEASLQLDAGTRRAFLLQACPDQEVREEVERLLACEAERGDFLSQNDTGRSASLPPEVTAACRCGEILANRFKIARFLAKGGMGEVYEAEDLELHEPVALKVISPELLLSDDHSLERFKCEVQLARQVTHPNVCRTFDLFRHKCALGSSRIRSDLVFLSMELLHGETLSRQVRRTGRLSAEVALPFALQMLAGLQAAHAVQILHRDFKPSNVFLDHDRDTGKVRAVITDFGVARALRPDTITDQFVGTPTYMSPEQIAGHELTPASDIYAVGLVLYEMVTGARPFAEDTPLMSVSRRLSSDIPSPRLIVPELDPVWETVILRCLQRDLSGATCQRRKLPAPFAVNSARACTFVTGTSG